MIGDCFVVAARAVIDDANALAAPTLVHGLPVKQVGEHAGERFWHAWVEVMIGEAPFVIDDSNGRGIVMPRDRYYEIGQLTEAHVHRYERGDALVMLARERNYGPWVHGWEGMGL